MAFSWDNIYLGYHRVFFRAAGIFGVGRRPNRKIPKLEKAPKKSLAPRVHKILQEGLKWHEQCDNRSFL